MKKSEGEEEGTTSYPDKEVSFQLAANSNYLNP